MFRKSRKILHDFELMRYFSARDFLRLRYNSVLKLKIFLEYVAS